MKKCCKPVIILVAVMLIFTIGASSAFAATFGSCAESLVDLGLMEQAALESGFTRAEAANMLVKLMGAEDEAAALEASHPFTDVAADAAAAVNYLYHEGIIKGVSDGLFVSDKACDARMFTVLVLRMLGYNEAAGDFSYGDAVSFAKSIGLTDDIMLGGQTFLRDNAAALSYVALNTPLKDSADTFIKSLVAENVLTSTKANPYITRFAAIEDYNAAMEKFQNLDAVEMLTKAQMNMTNTTAAGDEEMAMDMEMQMKMRGVQKAVEDFSKVEMEIASTTSIEGEEDVIQQAYFKNGFYYTKMGELKLKMPLDLNGITNMSGFDTAQSVTAYMIEDMKVTNTTAGKEYAVTLDKSFMDGFTTSLLGGMEQSLGAVNGNISFGDLTMTIVIDKNGNWSGYDMAMSMSVEIENEKITMDMDMDMQGQILKTGDDVKIVFPDDLDSYIDFEEYIKNAV